MVRANNKMDMTITEQLAAIRKKMCDKYCKYSECKDKTEQVAHCQDCPLREV